MDELLDWTHAAADIPERGLDRVRAADAAERAALAEALELVALDRLQVSYRIESLGKGRVALTGRITAELTQSCVVSLEPVVSRIDESFAVELWPAAQIEAPPADDDPEAVEAEPIDADGRLPIGRIVSETLATVIDPYPRRADAAFEWRDEQAVATSAKVSPFAALASLKLKGE